MKTYKECDAKLNILGTEYTLHICPDSKDERFKSLNCDGFCDHTTKELFVSNYEDSDREISIKDTIYTIDHAVKHEIVHAFMFESGLGFDWEHKQFGQEETTVDWIAAQISKINDVLIDAFLKIKANIIDTEDKHNETENA